MNLVSQKRSTCCGTSSSVGHFADRAEGLAPISRARGRGAEWERSSATWHPQYARLALRRASALLIAILQHMGGAEHQHPARQDRHFLAGLRIAPDALALLRAPRRCRRTRSSPISPRVSASAISLEHDLHQIGGIRCATGRPLDTRPRSRSRACRSCVSSPWPARSACRRERVITLARNPSISRSWQATFKFVRWRPFTAYQRTSAEPQVKPPPMASISTRSPGLMRPSWTASASASGIEAAEVLRVVVDRHDHLLGRKIQASAPCRR